MKNLENLFNPQSIAIVGASEEAGKVGTAVTKNILELGYAGQVFLVNNKHEMIFGKKCYKNLAEIENAVDLAIVVIPAQFVNQLVKEAAGKIKNYVIISAGFSETGEEGKAREKELNDIAAQNNLNILGPNCLGFIIPSLKLNASFAGGLPAAGNISFVSQSGALIAATFDMAQKNGLKFSSVLSIGNKMDVAETEIIKYLERDEKTKVIALYLEGIKDGREFIKTCQQTKKPIIILKSGKNEKSQRAISSHTGALAGDVEIMQAVFASCGIMQAQNLEEFVNLMGCVSLSDASQNNLFAVITNAGGPGVLTTDAFNKKDIQLAEISEKTKAKLKTFLPAESSVENPIDLLGDADQARYQKSLKTLEKETGIGSIICVLTAQEQTPVSKITTTIIKFKNKTQKNISTVFIGNEKIKKSVAKIRENGIPSFDFPDQAVSALEKYYLWKKSQTEAPTEEYKINLERQAAVSGIIKKAAAEGRKALSFMEAKAVMDLYQIPTVETWDANGDVSHIKFPAVIKVDSDKVLHKTDKKALILNIQNQAELQKAMAEIRANFPTENIIAQPMMPRQTEIIAGIVRDSVFGPVLVYGLGGIYTEIFKIAEFLIPFQGAEEIEKSLMSGKLSFLFRETRGQKPYNIKSTVGILYGLQLLSQEIEGIKELDINPLLIYNDGREPAAVDVKIII